MDPRRRCGADLRLVRPAPRLRQSRSRFAAKTVPSSSSIPTDATESAAPEKTAAQNFPIKSLAQRRGRPCAQATVVDAFARAEVRSGGTPEPAGRMPTLPEIRPRPSGVCLFPRGGMRGPNIPLRRPTAGENRFPEDSQPPRGRQRRSRVSFLPRNEIWRSSRRRNARLIRFCSRGLDHPPGACSK